jgi:hypothetical protein
MKLEVGDRVRVTGNKKREWVIGSVTDDTVTCICVEDDTEKVIPRKDAEDWLMKID